MADNYPYRVFEQLQLSAEYSLLPFQKVAQPPLAHATSLFYYYTFCDAALEMLQLFFSYKSIVNKKGAFSAKAPIRYSICCITEAPLAEWGCSIGLTIPMSH